MNEFLLAIESVKQALSLLQSFNTVKNQADVSLKIVELTGIIIPLKERIEAMSVKNRELQDETVEQRKTILKFTEWEAQKSNHKLVTLPTGSFAYTINSNSNLTTGYPYFCQNCYDNMQTLSIYQPSEPIKDFIENVKHSCIKCKSEIFVPNSGYKPRNFPTHRESVW